MSPTPRLAHVVENVRASLRRRAAWAAAPWALVLLGVVLLAAWALAGPTGWVPGTAAPLLLDLALLGGLASGAWWLRRDLSRRLSDPALTRSLEELAELAPGAVLGPLELSRKLPPGVSASLAERAERGVVRELGLPEDRLAKRLGVDARSRGRRGWGAVALLAPLLVLAATLAPQRSIGAWKGLGRPAGLLDRPALPPLDVRPGDAEVPRGEDVEIAVSAPARDSVTLRWRAAGDVVRMERVAVAEGGARFVVRDVRAPVVYSVVAPDGAAAGDFTLTPVDPLFVADLSVELRFPPHTGRPPEEYRGDVPPLTVPAGTRLTLRGSASRELSGGALVGEDDGVVKELVVEGRRFSATWHPAAGGTFAWSFQDLQGEPAELLPRPLELTVVPDSAPRVRFTFPARDTVLPLDLRQPLVLEARDDHGVELLELVAYRVTSLGEREEPLVQALQLGGSRAVLARPLLDVSEWGLLPGDTVRYFARVRDNAPGTVAVETREYALRMPGAAELRRSAERRLEETAARLEELGERAARSEEETRNLERRAAADDAARERASALPGGADPEGDPVGFQEREDLRRSLEEQAGMEAEVDSLRAQLARMAEAMRQAGVSDPGLRETLDELGRLLEEISSVEDRERLRRRAEELGEMRGREAEQALRELLAQQEAFREQIERSLERFERAAVEQDFRATTAEAEELARQEEALAEAFREEDDLSGRTAQQDELEARAGTMEERMERLERRLVELGEGAAASEVREARRRSDESRAAMREAAREARQRRGERAGDRAEEAGRAMDEAARDLTEAQREMADRQAMEAERTLRSAADDALSLARRQSELREEMGSAGREALAELRSDVAAVQEGVRNMAESVAETAQQTPGGRELVEGMGRAMEALSRTVEAMEGGAEGSRTGRARAEAAVDALNQVALTAMAAARQAAQGGRAGGAGQSAGAAREELEDLAQRQAGLNNRAGQMMPLQLGQEALRTQLERLSGGQRSVAERLGDLAGRPGSERETLGDLEALAEEARALADELAGGRLEPETRRRQERLFHRLLDAGRSLENEELSDERESRGPGAFERGEVLPLGPEELRALRYGLPDAEALRRLTPAERRLVVRYFERLNRADPRGERGGAGGAGGGVP